MTMSFSVHLPRVSSTVRLGGRHRSTKRLPRLAQKDHVLVRGGSRAAPVIATDRALMLGHPDGTWQRINWAMIATATFSPIDRRLTLRLWPDDERDAAVQVHFAADQRIAAAVRERVEFHRLLSVRVELTTGLGGRVVALREADGVRWRIVADAPLNSPALRRAAADAIAEIRSLAGL